MTFTIRRATRREKTVVVDDTAARTGERPEEIRPKYHKGDSVPLLCRYCGDVFEHVIAGPGRWPTLCEICRGDKEARYLMRAGGK